ncbi:MAG: hypothetical protein GX879_05565 [Bacteroidales bacterium]|nr:hypothetical protein [Bacteroidales bacterium]
MPKIGSWALLLFMIMFTPLTLWLAVANPVSDCGCFGDALILSNWATFWKNVVLLLLAVFVFWYRKKFVPLFANKAQWVISFGFGALALVICFYALAHLPPLDFRPYKIGANINEGMQVPDSEKDNVDVYESVFVYEKDGKQQEFDIDNLPDDTWTFIDAEHKLVKQGYVPPIHDFSISKIASLDEADDFLVEEVDLYEALFTYEKNGEIQDFYISDLPNSEWQFVEIKAEHEINSSLVELVYESPEGDILDYSLFDLPEDGFEFVDAYYVDDFDNAGFDSDDITDIVLSNAGYTFMLISEDLNTAKTKHQNDINNLFAWAESKDYDFICLTASPGEEVSKFIEKNETAYKYYNTDPITLKTIIRANPGLVLIKDGTVINKWSHKDLPKIEQLERDLTAFSIEKLHAKQAKNLIYNYIFIGIWIMTILMWIQHYAKYKRK